MQIDLGVAVKNDKGEYVVLTGNQTGALTSYIIYYPKNKGKEHYQKTESY